MKILALLFCGTAFTAATHGERSFIYEKTCALDVLYHHRGLGSELKTKFRCIFKVFIPGKLELGLGIKHCRGDSLDH